MKTTIAALAFAGLVTLASGGAQATVNWGGGNNNDCCSSPLGGSFAVTIWNANTADAGINSASQQALPTNPIVAPAFKIGSGVYSGGLNFNYDPSRGTPTIGGFFASGPGTYTGTGTGATISAGNFSKVTVMEFSFTLSTPLTNVVFSHDDGVSLFAAGSSTDLLPLSASAPTTDADATLSYLAAGTYNLWYAEANGVPAVLCVDPATGGPAMLPTPEPASLSVLGAGLAAVGLIRRRRRA